MQKNKMSITVLAIIPFLSCTSADSPANYQLTGPVSIIIDLRSPLSLTKVVAPSCLNKELDHSLSELIIQCDTN